MDYSERTISCNFHAQRPCFALHRGPVAGSGPEHVDYASLPLIITFYTPVSLQLFAQYSSSSGQSLTCYRDIQH